MSAFPPMDYSRFKWRKSSYDPSKFIREIAAGEVVNEFANHNHNELVLFLGANIDSHVPLPDAPTLKTYARAAWAHIRRTIPTLAAHVDYDATGTSLLSYRIPTPNEIEAWLDRTVHAKLDVTDIDKLRTSLSQEPTPDQHGDMTWLYLLRKSDTSLGLLLHTSHIPFDGSAGKILINMFLRHFVESLTNGTAHVSNEPWGKEVELLCPCTTEILAPDEVRQGDPRYDQTLGEILTTLGQTLPNNHGLRTRALGPGPTQRIGHTFTSAESERILSRLKQKGYTPNHAVQAALTLLTLRDNPPDPSSNAVVAYYGLVNARKRLAAPYNTREGYPGYCLAMSVLHVPVNAVSPQDDDKKAVKVIADVLKAQYLRQKEYPAFLAAVPQEVEMMLAPVKQAIASGGPLPPPWHAPWYLGDGIGEQYLDPQHVDKAGKVVLDIPDCFVSVNKTDPGPCCRCHSWRGRLVLMADYNVRAMPLEEMEVLMKEWIRLLWLLVEQ